MIKSTWQRRYFVVKCNYVGGDNTRTTIGAKDAINILRKKYEREYKEFENVVIEFGKDESSYTWQDFELNVRKVTNYELYGLITYERKVNDLVISYEIKKDESELQKDLGDELREYYSTDDFEIKGVEIIPDYRSKDINYEKLVKVFINEKSKKLIK